jgi:hypothetical protein
MLGQKVNVRFLKGGMIFLLPYARRVIDRFGYGRKKCRPIFVTANVYMGKDFLFDPSEMIILFCGVNKGASGGASLPDGGLGVPGLENTNVPSTALSLAPQKLNQPYLDRLCRQV